MTSQSYYEFGPFRMNTNAVDLECGGKPVYGLNPTDLRVLALLLKHHGRTVRKEDFLRNVWEGKTVEQTNLAVSISKIRKLIAKSSIETVHGIGYKFTQSVRTVDENRTPTTSLFGREKEPLDEVISPELHRRLLNFCDRNHLPPPIDGYVQLEFAPRWRGWTREQVSVFSDVEEYKPPPELKSLMRRFPAEPDKPVNKTYGLCSYKSLDATEDSIRTGEEPRLEMTAYGGTWQHFVALKKAWDAASTTPPDDECARFRDEFEADILNIGPGTSRLYHVITTDTILITRDDKVVVGRRSQGTSTFQDTWCASLEEGLMREKDDRTRASDSGDLFACAHRGAMSELGVTVIPEATRLLGFGCEFRNFGACFIFLVRCEETFAEVTAMWGHADDMKEFSCIDCIGEDDIPTAFARDKWLPTKSAVIRQNEPPGRRASDYWHPTSRARLHAYWKHLKAIRS